MKLIIILLSLILCPLGQFFTGGKNYKVIGHGLNKQELEKNKIFDSYWIQNFNLNQKIPLESGSIDYCLMVAAWQYLQYPENLTKEILKILSNKGKIIVSFSNRAFWHKAPNIWTTSTENERVKYVRQVLMSNGFNEPIIIKKFNEPTLNFNFSKKILFIVLLHLNNNTFMVLNYCK